ncbi:MAG TPA: hypothetical protein VNX87_20190 [Candidatus Sulfotelmatobacter sp.]|jgi:hypothetical protein|nr:hypothetical protein [Candidatus Sulfotelmatobacter sp.]
MKEVMKQRLERALVRRPHTEEELTEIVAEIDRLIHDLEEHQIQLWREWLRKHPRERQGGHNERI